MPDNYEAVMRSRMRKILDVATTRDVEVLILGAWGCGAFRNPADTVARLFHELLPEYDFETVEFAMSRDGDSVFHKEFASELVSEPVTRPELPDDTVKDTIISLLKATGRENVERMISWMESNSFFEASASVSKHNAFRGGLARHSLEVYHEAMPIWWHMGEYEKAREYHQKEYTESLGTDLCNLIREADRTAADKAMPADGATE